MTGHNPPVDTRQAADKFMDSEVYFKTGDVAAAQKAAKAYLTGRDYLFARG
jgi:long-subunit acyl-CoA synthetase (AMP-forming)